MSDSLNNKELVAVSHDFAKAMNCDTPIIEIAKMMSRLCDKTYYRVGKLTAG